MGFRVDAQTKALVERAAHLDHRNVTDFCMSALSEAARQTIARHQTLSLTPADLHAFFEALMHPPAPNARLKRAFRSERRQIARDER
jgi:uncharacterized protein (DUF1778 family)